MTVDNLIGQRFGRWVVLSKGTDKQHWVCRCDCGTTKTVSGYCLKTGESESCGCLRHYLTSYSKNVSHGQSMTKLYSRWLAMKRRCFRKSDPKYPRYGARGITVCRDWLDFARFYEYIRNNLGDCPSGCSLDRINNDGNYEPGNVRWSTARQQGLNREASRVLVGKRYGCLVVLDYPVEFSGRHSLWTFRCDCGNIVKRRSGHVKMGLTKSCGCVSRELRVAGFKKTMRRKKLNGKKTPKNKKRT